jgi:hypothetical protein
LFLASWLTEVFLSREQNGDLWPRWMERTISGDLLEKAAVNRAITLAKSYIAHRNIEAIN